MKIISDLCDYIDEELCDAEKYIDKALQVKETYPALAQVFATLSAEELKHMNVLHTEVVKLIQEYREKKGEPPAEMLAVYNYLHNKFIEHAKDIHIMQEMYHG